MTARRHRRCEERRPIGAHDDGRPVGRVLRADFLGALADTSGAGGAIVAWAPTHAATVVKGYSPALPVAAKSARLVELEDGSATGSETALMISSGHVSIVVSETPSIILVDVL